MTEYELVAEVEAFLKANGAEDNFMLVASGGTEVTGMKLPTGRKFQPGDCVTTELTPQVNGYYAQICRTLVIGAPNDKQLQAYSIFPRPSRPRRICYAPAWTFPMSRACRTTCSAGMASANTPGRNTHASAVTTWACIPTSSRMCWKTFTTS